MQDQFLNRLVPTLAGTSDPEFNIFDVMHHGMHEKQLSNVFAWLLDVQGSHGLGNRFLHLFLDAVNAQRGGLAPFPREEYAVRQEVNTVQLDQGCDIADIVLQSPGSRIVVENYRTSDGHGHGFTNYQTYSVHGSRNGAVVLLCQYQDRALLTRGWEGAVVLSYQELVGALFSLVEADAGYRRDHPGAFMFLDQMRQKFARGVTGVSVDDVLGFVTAMCETGEVIRYQRRQRDVAAEQFASDVAAQARERFHDGYGLLQDVKSRLRAYGRNVLVPQINESLENRVVEVSTRFVGMYQWTVNFQLAIPGASQNDSYFQIKFGPSAWYALELDDDWDRTKQPADPDYSRLFLTCPRDRAIRQSAVALREVLAELTPQDRRLHDEIVRMLTEATSWGARVSGGVN